MQSQIEKALKLAKRTGDRLIVFDSPKSESAFVVMNLEQYEDLLEGDCGGDCQCGDHHDDDYGFEEDFDDHLSGLTEEEMLDKINRDIANWKEANSMEEMDQELAENEVETVAYPTAQSEPKQEEPADRLQRSRWAIRNDIKEAAEEIIEEDRHYLEEVNF